MKILTSSQVRIADSFSINHQQISSDELMERAAGKCFEWIVNQFKDAKVFHVFCGTGNNGGDGMVIARLLHLSGYQVKVWLLDGEKRSTDNQLNLERLKSNKIEIYFTSEFSADKKVEPDSVLIDAVLGSGLRLPLSDEIAQLLSIINRVGETGVPIIAVDCPSGFGTEQPMPPNTIAVKADYTLSFHCPRKMFFFAESEIYTGSWEVLDIGLDEPADMNSDWYYLLSADIKQLIRKRKIFSHKGSFGHVLLAGGSRGHCGSIALAAEAGLRSGTGLVTALLPPCCEQAFHAVCREAMTLISGDLDCIGPTNILTNRYTAIGFGTGASTRDDTSRLLKFLIQESEKPLVIDADGINILSENKTWLAFLPPLSILTPHPGEFDRLAGKSESAFDRFEKATELSARNNLIIVLKDAYTRIILPDGRVFYNSTGNPGMATAGSGDVLTGLITGLLAQSYRPDEAALLGVFLHGLAGDIAAAKYTMQAMTAGDILLCLPEAWNLVQS